MTLHGDYPCGCRYVAGVLHRCPEHDLDHWTVDLPSASWWSLAILLGLYLVVWAVVAFGGDR